MKKNYKTKVFCRLSVMRVAFCSILLLSLNAFWISSSVYGQQNVKRISLKQEQVSVLDALREINRLSDNMVVFKKEEVEKETKRVTIDLKDVTVWYECRRAGCVSFDCPDECDNIGILFHGIQNQGGSDQRTNDD